MRIGNCSTRRLVSHVEEDVNLIKVRVEPLWRTTSQSPEDMTRCIVATSARLPLHTIALGLRSHPSSKLPAFCSVQTTYLRGIDTLKDQKASNHLMAAVAAHCVLFSGRVSLQLQQGYVPLSSSHGVSQGLPESIVFHSCSGAQGNMLAGRTVKKQLEPRTTSTAEAAKTFDEMECS